MWYATSIWLCTTVLGFSLVISAEPQDEGLPLFLTPLIEANNISEAKGKSRVSPDVGNTTSYSGFFTVNKSCESNLFFWFFLSQNNWQEAPVIIFLEGGPGVSGIRALFNEIGPLTFTGKVGSRNNSWNVQNNLLVIDQPVGTGFSFTGKGCYAKDENDVGRDLYSAVVQFFQLFPELQENKFFITGQSYAGRFAPALGHFIYTNNPTAKVKINLSGFMIGSGWMDIRYQYDYGSYLYQLGLIDDEGREIYYEKQNQSVQYLKNQEWEKGVSILTEIIRGDVYKLLVGNVSDSNYLLDDVDAVRPYIDFIKKPKIRKALHVGAVNYSYSSDIVFEKFGLDLEPSVKTWIEELLEHYYMVFYSGQLDIICGYPMIVNFLKALSWSGTESFKHASRHKWCVDGRQAGYIKSGHNLHDVFVRSAEHKISASQPGWVFELVNSVTSSSNGYPLSGLQVC